MIDLKGLSGVEIDKVKKVYHQGKIDGIEEVYNKLDEGVCDMCKYEHEGCFKECDKNGWEFETFKEWLKEQIGVKND